MAEFENLKSRKLEDVHKAKLTQCRIDSGNSRPFEQNRRSLPHVKREGVRNYSDKCIGMTSLNSQLVLQSLISPSYATNRCARFCADFRRPNDFAQKNNYHIPQLKNTLNTLPGTKWFI